MAKKSKNQKTAEALLKGSPEETQVYITEDGQPFFCKAYAERHHRDKGFEKDIEVFFREGFEPEDEEDLQKALELRTAEKEELDEILASVDAVADLEQDYEPVEQDTHETVTAVIALRERLKVQVDENTELKKEIEELKKQLENGKTKTDSKETK